jgi:hypothetical protein
MPGKCSHSELHSQPQFLKLLIFFKSQGICHYVVKTGPKFQNSSGPPASASQVAGDYRYVPLSLAYGLFFFFF